MISDTLHEATREITRYLTDPTYALVYTGTTRKDLLALVAQMNRMQRRLGPVPQAALQEVLLWAGPTRSARLTPARSRKSSTGSKG